MSWLGQQLTDAVQSLLIDILNQMVKWAIDILNSVLVTPFNMSAIPGYSSISTWLIASSFAWLSVLLGKELMMNMLEGANETHPLIIIKNAVVSGVLISASPIIVTGIVLPAMQFILQEVETVFGGGSGNLPAMTSDLQQHILLATGTGLASNTLLATTIPEGSVWVACFFVASLLFVFLWVGFSSGMRWIELIFLAVIGPALALSKASYGNAWDLWIKEVISVALSQVIQAFSIFLGMTLFINPISDISAGANAFMWLFISVGGFIFAIRGPKTLRNIIGAPSNGLKAVQSLAGTVSKAAVL